MKIFDKLKDMLADHLTIDHKKINLNSDLVNDLGADSLDMVEFLMMCEEEFDIEISDARAEKIVTVQDGVDVVMELI